MSLTNVFESGQRPECLKIQLGRNRETLDVAIVPIDVINFGR
jgi:hypothetical protein